MTGVQTCALPISDVLGEVAVWEEERAKQMTETLPVRIFIDSSDPDELSGISPDLISTVNQMRQKVLKKYRDQIAEHVGGTEQHFVDMMNERAAQIGCTNTHFVNASGLPDPDHYSTAHDMALIMREGLKNKKFRSEEHTSELQSH